MGDVTIATASGAMPVFDARPSADARGAVVVVQEAFGVGAHIRDVTRRVADAGYRAVAPHLFYRTGDPALSYDDLPAVMPHMQALTMQGLLDDLDAVIGYLGDGGFEKPNVGVVGFCMGGSVALLAGARCEVGAAVSFYGGGVVEGRFGMPPLVELAPQLRAPWLGLYGDLDKGIPVEQVESLREAAATASVETEVVRYAEAQHGFHCDARPAVFNGDAARDAWARTLDWFGRHLSGAS